MSYQQTVEDIFTEVQTQWTYTDIAWPNVRFTPESGVPYLQMNIGQGAGQAPGVVGNDSTKRFERGAGDIVGSLFFPADYNPSTAAAPLTSIEPATLAETLKDLLSSKQIGSTITFVGRVADAGLDDGQNWYRLNVIVPYQTNVLKNK